jgi:hypothetical protein
MHLANASACLKSLLMSLPPPALLPLVVDVAEPPRLATPPPLSSPPQPATPTASSRPSSSPILMRVIALLLLRCRPGLLVVPCPLLRLAGVGVGVAPGCGVVVVVVVVVV